jgi:hypothetical protein
MVNPAKGGITEFGFRNSKLGYPGFSFVTDKVFVTNKGRI